MRTWQLETTSVEVGSGRTLEVVLAGPPDGLPLFAHHGTPGAASAFEPLVDVGAERRLRHIIYSRPGYGRSTRRAHRSVADCIDDVVAIADALGYERFYSVGSSGGGPHSIACAALLSERVIAAASIASPAPGLAEGLDWTAEMGDENVAEVAACRASDGEFEAYLEEQAKALAGATAEEIVTVLGDLVSEPDRRALTGAVGEFIVHESAHALSGGVWGWFDDDRTLLGEWGFDLNDVQVPLSLWHGGQDRFVPIAHGEWLAAHVRCDAHLLPEHGHLSLALSSYGAILDRLLAS